MKEGEKSREVRVRNGRKGKGGGNGRAVGGRREIEEIREGKEG